jgi:hypothetical protein|tara:strand:+ start:425 stop:637 length:213 start_codon:yes stop_codon:yes gene_type:complete
MGWLLKIILDDRKTLLVFFNSIKLGIINTSSSIFYGRSIVFGILRVEFQFNIAFHKTKKIQFFKEDLPHA